MRCGISLKLAGTSRNIYCFVLDSLGANTVENIQKNNFARLSQCSNFT